MGYMQEWLQTLFNESLDGRLFQRILRVRGNCDRASRREASLPVGMTNALRPELPGQWSTLQDYLWTRTVLPHQPLETSR